MEAVSVDLRSFLAVQEPLSLDIPLSSGSLSSSDFAQYDRTILLCLCLLELQLPFKLRTKKTTKLHFSSIMSLRTIDLTCSAEGTL